MFTSNTTIVLGAGASYDFGAPLGEELWNRINRSCTGLLAVYRDFWDGPVVVGGVDQFLSDRRKVDPKAFAYFFALKEMQGDVYASAASIADQVSRANFHTSVDDFLRDNPSLVGPIRVLIAATLFEGLYERNDRTWRLRNNCFEPRFTSPWDGSTVENWVRLFVGMCRPLLARVEAPIPVQVISFNYDRLLETLLSEMWQVAERKYPSLDQCFRFCYPYGAFSQLPHDLSDPAKWIGEQSPHLGLADGGDCAIGNEIRAIIEDSHQVFSLGFSWTETNLQLLGIREGHRKFFVQNFRSRDARLNRTLSRLGIGRTDTGSMSELVRNGFFEQLYDQ